jgi:group I intron endonuclease
MATKNFYGFPENEWRTLCSAGIYRITNLVTKKVYIGSTVKQLNRRWASHITNLEKNKHHSPYLQSSWNKYGKENFQIDVVEICFDTTKEYVNEREQWWLEHYQSFYSDYGYNVNKKADRKTYTQNQKDKVALRKNPEGFLIYDNKDDLDPIQVFNLKDFCEKQGWNYEGCFATACGRRRSYKGKIIKYADFSKNKKQVSEYQKYMLKENCYLVEDTDPNFYIIEYANNLVSFEFIYKFDKQELRKKVLNKIYKNQHSERYWRIWYPEGATIITKELQSFAKENNLSAPNLTHVAYGQKNHHKQFKCRQVILKSKFEELINQN